MEQRTRVTVKHSESNGVLLTVCDSRGREWPLGNTHEYLGHLTPGDSLTINATSDERWVAARAAQGEPASAEPAQTDQAEAEAASEAAPKPRAGRTK